MGMNDFEKEVFDTYKKEVTTKDKHINNITIMLIVALIVAIIALVAAHGMTLLYLYQYDFETTVTTTTVEQDSGLNGNANYIGGDGDIHNGQAKDNKN